MFFKQFYLGCLAHASYMIADEKAKIAAVVDPQRDVDQYLALADEHGWRIQYVILTHFHADFLAGHIELRDKAGATIMLGARAEAEYKFTPLHEGANIEFGEVRLTILETPGHTPEGISILVYDLAASALRPYAVLTGDALFIGDVGRPDLLASIGVSADELANMLYDSIRKLERLPDETLVYPAHGAGSMCGKNLSKETVSTIGAQKKFNYAMQPMAREQFVKLVAVDQPEAPDYFLYDAVRNRQERPSLDRSMAESMRPLSLDEVLQLQRAGAQVVDVRDAADYEAAHLRGSINVGLRGKYATWCGTVLHKDQPIVVVAESGNEEEAVMRLGRIGFDHVAGYLKDGMLALAERPDLLRAIDRVTAPALAELLDSPNPPHVLDVRAKGEWEAGHIAGSQNIPLNRLAERINEVPRANRLVVHCEGGYRSAIAASLLANEGFANLLDLVGGFKAWQASRQPGEPVAETCAISKPVAAG